MTQKNDTEKAADSLPAPLRLEVGSAACVLP